MVDESKISRSSWPQRTVAVVVATLFGGAVLWGLLTVGTPGMARSKELDRARIRDLREISRAIQRFFDDEGRLPNSLQDLDLDPDTLVDPISKKSYEYVVKDSRNYQLAAEFAVADEDRGGFYERNWSHRSGLHYFNLEVESKPEQT